MERSVHFRAIVVRHTNYDEADRFITFLTPFQGRVSALAKGVRKMNSRKAGHLQPFTYVSVQLSKGRGASWLVAQVSTIEAYPDILASLEKTVRTSWVLELAERFSLENMENVPLFQLTLDTLRRIAVFPDIFPVQRYFDLHLLSVTGYQPQLFECVRCHKKIQAEDQYIHYGLGGVLCPDCGSMTRESLKISMKTLKYFRYYQTHSFPEAAAAGWPAEIRSESETLLTGYQNYLLERKTNSQRFLEHLDVSSQS